GVADIVGERRAARLQNVEREQRLLAQLRRHDLLEPPAAVRAQENRDAGGEMRPRHFAGQAEHVEHRRLVFLDALRQYVTLPRIRGDLVTVELCDYGAKSVDAGEA